MQTQIINFNRFAPVLETGKQLTKSEFIKTAKTALNTSTGVGRWLAQLVECLPYFNVVKAEGGQVIVS